MAAILNPRHAIPAVIFAAGMMLSGAASAACNAVISNATPDQVVFNPFDGVLAFKEFDVRIVNGGEDACTLAIAAKGDATGAQRRMRNGVSELVYLVKTEGNVELGNDLAAPGGYVQLPGGAGSEATLRLRIEIPAGQMEGAGSFSDLLTLRLYDIETAPTPVGLDTTVTVSGLIPARAQVNIAGADAAFGAFTLDQLNFGELAEGATRNGVVQVRATAPVRVTVQSQYRGVLRHRVLGETVPSVPYSLSLAGTVGDLTTGVFAIDRTPPMTLAGENYPLLVTIGSIEGRVAGQYQDILTVSVVPR